MTEAESNREIVQQVGELLALTRDVGGRDLTPEGRRLRATLQAGYERWAPLALDGDSDPEFEELLGLFMSNLMRNLEEVRDARR